MKKILVLALLCATLFGHNGDVKAGLTYSTIGSTVTENFNGLSSTINLNHTWTNNVTLSGWYSDEPTYRAATGSDNTGSLYSFGNSADRALGGLGSNGTGPILFGVRLTNATGATLDSITITFDGEQWRRGGGSVAHSLTFDYKIATTVGISDGSGYNSVSQLGFTGPISSGTAAALDGNLNANRVAGITHTISGLSWASGQQLMLRWTDLNDSGNDHGLAIDNFSFSAVPEPSALILVGSIIGAGLLRRRRA